MLATVEEGAKMNKINKCDSCNNVYSHRQSLWRHRQNCNNKRIRAVEQSIKKPQDHDTVATIFPEQSVQNQQHNKALNPKISALTDSIVE